jgi:hypothetical protein
MNKFKKQVAILGAAAALALSGSAISATPFAFDTQKAEAVTYSKCYTAMNGERWCYQSGCNFYEYWVHGCRDGWVRTNTWYA